jgi:drug/metabolite transporter (DMT)-like permease
VTLFGAAIVFAIIGAVVDFRYKRNGGKKSNKKDLLWFGVAVLLIAAFYVTLVVIGGSTYAGPEIIGYTVVPIFGVLFAAWELGRWRVRRKNPLAKEPEPAE